MDSGKKVYVLKGIVNLDLVIAGIALIVLVTTTFLGVIMRYFLNNPFVWLQEVQLTCFIWVVFLGAGAAFRTGSHVAIEFIVDHMHRSIRKPFEVLIYGISVAILLYFLIHGSRLVNQLYVTERTTNILDIPYFITYSAFPLSCILMIVNFGGMLIKDLGLLNRAAREGELNGN